MRRGGLCCGQRKRGRLDLDLEAYSVAVVGALWHDGDNTQGIGESSSILLVVSDLDLKLRPRLNSLTHPVDGNLVDAFHSIGRVPHLARSDLEKTAVASDDFVHGISGHVAEGFGSIDDRAVGLLKITHDEGDRAIDRTKLDLGTRSRDYLKLEVYVSQALESDSRMIDIQGSTSCRNRWLNTDRGR